MGCLQPGGRGVPASRGGFQASNNKEGFPTPRRENGKTRRGDDKKGCCLVTVGGGWSGSCCRGRRKGLDFGGCRLRTLKRCCFDAVLKKIKIN